MNGYLRRAAARAWNPPSVRTDPGITPLSLARLASQQKVTPVAASTPRAPREPTADHAEPAVAAARRDTALDAVGEEVPPLDVLPAAPTPTPPTARQRPIVFNRRRGGVTADVPDDGASRRTPGPVEPPAVAIPAHPATTTRREPDEPRREDPPDPSARPTVVVRRQAPARSAVGRRDRRPDPVVVRIGRVELTVSAAPPPPPSHPTTAASSRPVVSHPDLLSAHRRYLQRGSAT